MDQEVAVDEPIAGYMEMTPATLQRFTSNLLEHVARRELPKLGGLIRLSGVWLGDPKGQRYAMLYDARVERDGIQAKVEILASLPQARGIQIGQRVVVTGELTVDVHKNTVTVKVAASDIELAAGELSALEASIEAARMTLDGLKVLDLARRPFPDDEPIPVALLHSASANTQVHRDCLHELEKLGGTVVVTTKPVSMADAAAIAASIAEAPHDAILILIRGGGETSDFEVFNDRQVVTALAEHKAYRVIGLGHDGDKTLLDLVADHSASTPAQAGTHVREEVSRRQDRTRALRDYQETIARQAQALEAAKTSQGVAEARQKDLTAQLETAQKEHAAAEQACKTVEAQAVSLKGELASAQREAKEFREATERKEQDFDRKTSATEKKLETARQEMQKAKEKAAVWKILAVVAGVGCCALLFNLLTNG